MRPFIKIAYGILIAGLLIMGGYYFTVYNHAQRQLTSLKTQQLAEQRFLVQSRYQFPILSLTQSIDEKESSLLPLIFQKFLPQAPTLLHLGAHTGLHTLLAGRHLAPNGKILAFEGHPKLVSLLKENLNLHHLEKKVSVFSMVPSSQSSSLSVCFDADPLPSADTPITQGYEQQLKGGNCHTITLKALDTLPLPKVDFIFIENDIDTPSAIKGAYKLLEKSKWPALLIEPTLFLKSPEAHGLLTNLCKKGYTFYKLSLMNGLNLRIEKAEEKESSFDKNSYLLCSQQKLEIS
ncbi:MAG: hypothetical protein ACK5PQ_01775 [Alphaproteobacteria bacterium]